MLVNARLEAKQRHAMRERMRGEMVDEHDAVAGAAELRAHVHSLQLAILPADELDPTAAGGLAVGT